MSQTLNHRSLHDENIITFKLKFLEKLNQIVDTAIANKAQNKAFKNLVLGLVDNTFESIVYFDRTNDYNRVTSLVQNLKQCMRGTEGKELQKYYDMIDVILGGKE